MNGIFIRTARRSALAQVRHVSPVPPGAAQDLVARVYAQVERDFGMLAPPIGLHAPAPGPLAASWSMLRETLLATGLASRAAKEAVGIGVSVGNACPYCVEVHDATLRGLPKDSGRAGAPGESTLGGTVRLSEEDVSGASGTLGGNGGLGRLGGFGENGAIEGIADPVVRRIAAWARATGRRDPSVRPEPPFPAEQAPELIGVAVTFHYLNRMVNVFLRESPFPPSLPAAARGGLMRLLTRTLRPATREFRRPGASLDLLPAAPLPEDLSWAAASPSVAGAFARAAAAIEAVGSRSVPESVRDLVMARLGEWTGEAPGLSRAWVDDAVAGLPPGERPAGRLALLTALASYQIDEPVIEACRDRHDDESLIGLTSWASMAAARRVGAWTRDGQAGRYPSIPEPADGERTPGGLGDVGISGAT